MGAISAGVLGVCGKLASLPRGWDQGKQTQPRPGPTPELLRTEDEVGSVPLESLEVYGQGYTHRAP